MSGWPAQWPPICDTDKYGWRCDWTLINDKEKVRLFHSLLAQPKSRAICLRFRLCKLFELQLLIWSHNELQLIRMHWTCRHPQSIFKTSHLSNNDMQMSIADLISYSTGNPTANRLVLCSILWEGVCSKWTMKWGLTRERDLPWN